MCQSCFCVTLALIYFFINQIETFTDPSTNGRSKYPHYAWLNDLASAFSHQLLKCHHFIPKTYFCLAVFLLQNYLTIIFLSPPTKNIKHSYSPKFKEIQVIVQKVLFELYKQCLLPITALSPYQPFICPSDCSESRS